MRRDPDPVARCAVRGEAGAGRTAGARPGYAVRSGCRFGGWTMDGGAVAQLGERLNGIQEVRGSTPLSSMPGTEVFEGLHPLA